MLALVLLSTPSAAQTSAVRDVQLLKSYCNLISETAYLIMASRQNGTAITSVMNIMTKQEGKVNEATQAKTKVNLINWKSMIQDAYSEAEQDSEDKKVKAALDFQKKWLNVCKDENALK